MVESGVILVYNVHPSHSIIESGIVGIFKEGLIVFKSVCLTSTVLEVEASY